MKIAVLSDIHGNIAALEAVLRDAMRRGATQCVNLGDICSGALFPRETAERLMALDLPTIRGNHERQATEHPLDDMGPSDKHAATSMTSAQLQWLADLPLTLRLNEDVLMVHGTPTSDLIYLLETVTPDGMRAATDEEIKQRLATADAKVILCGHTHIARVVRLSDGRLIVNPGSVGLQAYADDHPYPHVVEVGSPHARYAMLSFAERQWQAELFTVDYDWQEAASEAEANGRSDWAIALRTGFMS